MHDFNSEYFFIRYDDDNLRLPFMTPDVNTAERRYSSTVMPMSSAPLIFTNGWREDFKRDRIKEEIADVLFDASSFIVRDPIRMALLSLNLPGIWLHPAIYIDDAANWHEDFWYVGFHGFFDCWDRSKSRFNPTARGSVDDPRHRVYAYSLNNELLAKTPLNERLLFRMGGTVDGLVVAHQSVAKLLRSGARIQPVNDK